MDQQANRLLYEIEDVGDIVLGAGKAATVAGRCSVFAKSDMIHAQQKGYQPPEVLKGLCNAVVRNFRGAIARGKTIDGAVAFVGGVAANKGAAQAMREAFELPEERFFVPRYYAWMGASGAALLNGPAVCDYGGGGRRQTGTDPALRRQLVPATPQRTRGEGPHRRASGLDHVILLRTASTPMSGPRPRVWVAGGRLSGVETRGLHQSGRAGHRGNLIKELSKTDGRPEDVV